MQALALDGNKGTMVCPLLAFPKF